MTDLRLAFAGTPDFAANIFNDLCRENFAPEVVYTQPDREAGRGRKLVASAVKQAALSLESDIVIEQPASLRHADAQARLKQHQPDVFVVVAYGLILPAEILAIPRYGCINVHASLLPRWRGAAPIERAYMAGDSHTGVSIMQMDAGLDTGPVFRTASCPLGTATVAELEQTLAHLGSKALLATLRDLQAAKSGKAPLPTPTAQSEEGATYAHKLTAADRTLDFSMDAQKLARQINALAERLPVRVHVADKRIQLLAASCAREKAFRASRGASHRYGQNRTLYTNCNGAVAYHKAEVRRW